ncbi:MAG: transposase [Candidatus Margulisiibacteriota bacterium]
MTEKELVKRKSPRLKDYDYSTHQAYFITICSFERNKCFAKDAFNQEIVSCLKEERTRSGFLVYVYCLMPDHLHLLLSPPGDALSVSRFIGGFKSKTTRIAWNYGIQGKLWQGRFYDHVLRKKEKMNVIGEYILNNPVRKGLVKDWRKYQYCGIIDGWI